MEEHVEVDSCNIAHHEPSSKGMNLGSNQGGWRINGVGAAMIRRLWGRRSGVWPMGQPR